MAVINHQNNFATNLTSNQIAGVTTTPLNSIPSVAAPFYIALDATNTNGKYEVVYVTSKTATNINHAATTYAHTTAEEVRMVLPATEIDSLWTAATGAAQGHLVNGKISVTDAAGITVAIKTLAGTDPSTTDPVYVRIGDTVRSITAALSVSKADGTNWCNAGSAELATKEIDYFVYLGYNATDGVTIGFSRYPGANSYDDFSATTTNEKYCAISTITNAAATDYYEVVGRFAATLSAGAGYTWTVPTYTAKNLIQRPIYETRWLTWVPTRSVSGGTAPTYTNLDQNKYRISGNRLEYMIAWDNTAGGTAGVGTNPLSTKLPFSFSGYSVQYRHMVGSGNINESAGTVGMVTHYVDSASSFAQFTYANASIAGQDQSSTVRFVWGQGFYEI